MYQEHPRKTTGGIVPHLKFDTAKLERLNDPGRFDSLIPDVMWAALGDPPAETIVEIGAGTALFSAEFAKRAPGATVIAVDIEPVMIEWMTANRPEVAQGRVVPLLATETAVPLPDASADVVAMINLHHELVDPVATYTEALRLLRPGGRLLVADWAARDTGGGPPLAVRITEADLVALLAGSGFENVTAHGGLPKHSLVTARKPGPPA